MGAQPFPGHSHALNVVVSATEAPRFGAHPEGTACGPGPQPVLQGFSLYGKVFQDL